MNWRLGWRSEPTRRESKLRCLARGPNPTGKSCSKRNDVQFGPDGLEASQDPVDLATIIISKTVGALFWYYLHPG
jgi:hypothetical protein